MSAKLTLEILENVVEAAVRKHIPAELRMDVRAFNDLFLRLSEGIIAMEGNQDKMALRLDIVEKALAAIQEEDGARRSQTRIRVDGVHGKEGNS